MECYILENSDDMLVNVHKTDTCYGDTCPIHRKTNHHMRSFPQLWRDDRRIIERLCSHGIGHPDPDHHFEEDDVRWLHGCDGCCVG